MSRPILKKIDIRPFSAERRIAPRYCVKFEVLIAGQKHSLRSRTVNLSLNGALMEDSAPKSFLRGPVDIMIIVPHQKTGRKTYLNFKGRLVGGPDSSAHLNFLDDKDQSFARLKEMLSSLANPAV